MFGEKGRYMYMTDSGYIHSDGDISIGSSVWKIEKLNLHTLNTDTRADYEKLHLNIMKESKRNTETLFQNTVKQFSLYNIGFKKYCGVAIENNTSYENTLIGTDDKIKFIIRPIVDGNCVYISYYLNGRMMNIFTIPRNKEAYVGAPECDWAKFYLIRRNNYYMFQCFHRESDINGNYGRYLCMRLNGELKIESNGCEADDISKWNIKEYD
jgi:hypothetical protein